MTHISHIDIDEHAEECLELFKEERSGFVRHALKHLSEGLSQDDTRERLVRKVKSDMRAVIFEHMKRTGEVHGDSRMPYAHLGYYYRVRRSPDISDVPSHLLDIEELMPNFQDEVGSIMLDAEKLKMIADIEATTRDAQS